MGAPLTHAQRDDTGSFLLLRDLDGGRVWSAGFQPCAVAWTTLKHLGPVSRSATTFGAFSPPPVQAVPLAAAATRQARVS